MKCAICGRNLDDNNDYYCFSNNIQVCNVSNCFFTYFWRETSNEIKHDKAHKFPVIDGIVYYVGSENDNPKGMSGKHFTIQFNDGTIVETNSLWSKGFVPATWKNQITNNAIFKWEK